MRQRKNWRIVLKSASDHDAQATNSRNDDITKYTATTVIGNTNLSDVIENDAAGGDCDECHREATYRSVSKRTAPLPFLGKSDGGRKGLRLGQPSRRGGKASYHPIDRGQETVLLDWQPMVSTSCAMDDQHINNVALHPTNYRLCAATTSYTPLPTNVAFDGSGTAGVADCCGGCQYCEMATTSLSVDVGDSNQQCCDASALLSPPVRTPNTCPDVVLTGVTTAETGSSISPVAGRNRLKHLTVQPSGE